jgi:hypothetical protein
MTKGLDSARQALDKLKATEARLKGEIKQREQQLRQAEKAQRERQTLAFGRAAMDLLPEPLQTDEALLTGFYLTAGRASPDTLAAWREAGERHLKPGSQP